MRPAIVLCCVVLLPCACGPKEGSDDEAGTAGEVGPGTAMPTTGDTPATEAGTTTEDGGATEPDATTEGPTSAPTTVDPTGDEMCDALLDIPTGPSKMISLTNASAGAVFLFHVNFCEEVPPIEISGPGSDVPVKWTVDSCEFTCGTAIEGACGCPAFCPTDQILMIAPGGTYSFGWGGALFAEATLPAGCSQDVSCGPECLRVEQAAPAVYTLRARAATSAIICESGEATCTCTPNAEGWCDVPATGIGAELKVAEATLDYPGGPNPVLTFVD
jgi:hypothetical protein